MCGCCECRHVIFARDSNTLLVFLYLLVLKLSRQPSLTPPPRPLGVADKREVKAWGYKPLRDGGGGLRFPFDEHMSVNMKPILLY